MIHLPLLRPAPGTPATVAIDPEMVLAISPLGLGACTVLHYTGCPETIAPQRCDVHASVREVRRAVEVKA